MRIVAEVSESEIRQQAAAQRVVEARRQAVVLDQRLARQPQVAQSRSANLGSKNRFPGEQEVGVRVAAENLQLLVQRIVNTSGVLIVVEAAASAGVVVVDRAVINTRCIGRRQ